MDTYAAFLAGMVALDRLELSRLLTAAVVSQEFREQLLTNPKLALESGFHGERFYFSKQEKARILAIQADSLQEFAIQLVDPALTPHRHISHY